MSSTGQADFRRPGTLSRETCTVGESRAGVRAVVVAMKRGNSRGAKGGRKEDM